MADTSLSDARASTRRGARQGCLGAHGSAYVGAGPAAGRDVRRLVDACGGMDAARLLGDNRIGGSHEARQSEDA
jgi:hypothetical protein